MNNPSLYYDKFLKVYVDYYRQTIKQAKPGHCMKIKGLPLSELQLIIDSLRDINPEVRVFILSDEEKGENYIHASKLIEKRNDNSSPLLVMIPVNSRTSAEDSYGDATFMDLAIDHNVKDRFRKELLASIPETEIDTWNRFAVLLDRYDVSDDDFIDYFLYLEQTGWNKKAWGEGLFNIGLLPDSKLLDNPDKASRRFIYNIMCSEILCDFSTSISDKVQQLPIAPDTIQSQLVDFYIKESALEDRKSICKKIYDSYPNLYFSNWVIPKIDTDIENVVVTVELMPGKDPDKELVKDTTGNYVLQLKSGKKGKIKIRMNFSLSSSELPELQKYQVQIVKSDGYVIRDELRNAKLGITGKTKTVTLNIPYGNYENGSYFLRVHALDANGVQLDNNNPFVPDSVQAQWETYLQQNAPDATPEKVAALKEHFQLENNVMCSNETTFVTIINADEDEEDIETNIDKRSKVDNLLQAYFNYRIEALRKGEILTIPDLSENKAWKEGSLNDLFTFDFGNAAYAYQIQNSRKLLELERAFYRHADEFGTVYAEISGNPTDTKIQDWKFIKLPSNLFVPTELIEARKAIFSLIKQSATSESGVLSIFPIFLHIEKIREYTRLFSAWLDIQISENPTETEAVALQNIDCVDLQIEMPEGEKKMVKLISPLHPIRLAWLVNIYDLYTDWEDKTLDNPTLQKAWYKKLDRLFMGDIPLEVSPLVLTAGAMKVFQYAGELTFGWGMYAIPPEYKEDLFGSEFRQLKSYVTSLLNITRDKQIDSDVNLDLVFRHLDNYTRSHIYADQLVINLFNAGDANVFADALVAMERRGISKDYKIRLFAEESLIQPGGAFRELLDPESHQSEAAETFSIASANRLFPKLRFSINSIQDFIKDPKKYQAHISFLINPFPVRTEMVRPDALARSFYLNGVIIKSAVSFTEQGQTKMWNRYFAQNNLYNPSNEFANESIVLFGRIESLIGKILSSTATQSLPATCLSIHERDAMLLSFIHQVSDWVVTFDKNMGPEFYDLPLGDSQDKPYLLDYIPGQERNGISSFLTALPTSEIEGLMKPQFEQFGINVTSDQFEELLEDVRAVSSSMVMQTQTTQNKAFEFLGITLTKRMLKKKGLLNESFIIPIDLHKELFENLESQNKERADCIVVNIDTEKKRINMMIVEVKCRQSLNDADEEALEEKMLNQMDNTIAAMEEHFGHSSSIYATPDRLDKELNTMELSNLLCFYIRRASRYNMLAPDVTNSYLRFLANLNEYDYEIDYKRMGIIFNLGQNKKQKKTPYGEAVIYKMGRPVIEDILSGDGSLDTVRLDADDADFVNNFACSNRNLEIALEPIAIKDDKIEPSLGEQIEQIDDIPSVSFPTESTEGEVDNQPNETSVIDDTSINIGVDHLLQEKSIPQITPSTYVPENHEKQVPLNTLNKDVVPKDLQSPRVTPNSQPQNPHLSSAQISQGTLYSKPTVDIFLGSETETPQFGIIGHTTSNNRKIALDLNGCNTISLFGVQGAGKSYTIGVVTEMMLKQFSNVNLLPSPLASVIFHYSETMDYAPEFTSMVYPNDQAKQLAKLKEIYGAEAENIDEVVLLTTESKLEERKTEFPNLEVHAISFDSTELQVGDWLFLLGAVGNDSVYIKEFKQILKRTRNDLTLKNIKAGVKGNQFLSTSQKDRALQRIQFAEEYIKDGVKLQQYLKPGRLVIVDLRDEYIEKDEALGLFVVMLNIFSGVKNINGESFNKFIVFDEAHKYMDDKKLVDAITVAIREMRHKGVSIMIASQDPVKLAPEIIELSSIILLHRFNSPAWVQHIKKAVVALGNLSATEMAALGSGEAYLWSSKASDKTVTTRPIKISIRPRVTKHGGDTIQAAQ